MKALFASVLAAHGRLDILVNDVGGGTSGHIWEAKVEDWDFIMRLNLRSAFLCTRGRRGAHARAPRRPHRQSELGRARGHAVDGLLHRQLRPMRRPRPAIHGFTRHAALELAEYGVAVNAVAPGPIETERTGPGFRKIEHLEYGPIRATPLRRIGVPGRHRQRRALSCLRRGQLHHRHDACRRGRTLAMDTATELASGLDRDIAALKAKAADYGARHRSSRNAAWPNGARIAVNFTADFDAMLLRRVLNEPPHAARQGRVRRAGRHLAPDRAVRQPRHQGARSSRPAASASSTRRR